MTPAADAFVADAYPYWVDITTRWMDNDMYGHVNNVHYYSFFDTAVTTWLMKVGGVAPASDEAIGLCVESQCAYRAPIAFPETVSAGLRVGHLGRTSVRYEIAVTVDRPRRVAATGHFVHVYVERRLRTPTPIPTDLRVRLQRLLPADGALRAGLPTSGA